MSEIGQFPAVSAALSRNQFPVNIFRLWNCCSLVSVGRFIVIHLRFSQITQNPKEFPLFYN